MTPSTAASTRLTPATLKAINDLVVDAAVKLGVGFDDLGADDLGRIALFSGERRGYFGAAASIALFEAFYSAPDSFFAGGWRGAEGRADLHCQRCAGR
jgi:hypothetical protein